MWRSTGPLPLVLLWRGRLALLSAASSLLERMRRVVKARDSDIVGVQGARADKTRRSRKTRRQEKAREQSCAPLISTAAHSAWSLRVRACERACVRVRRGCHDASKGEADRPPRDYKAGPQRARRRAPRPSRQGERCRRDRGVAASAGHRGAAPKTEAGR